MSDTDQMERLKEAKAKYDERVAKVLQKMPERKADFANTSGIPVNRAYTPLDMAGFDYLKQLGLPGAYPYTRAVQPTAYRGRFWTMRQYAGFATAEETNERYHFLLKSGQTGLSVAFDLPTQLGYDPDDPQARGEVGKVGVPIAHLGHGIGPPGCRLLQPGPKAMLRQPVAGKGRDGRFAVALVGDQRGIHGRDADQFSKQAEDFRGGKGICLHASHLLLFETGIIMRRISP
jgi:hypothetical protein